MNVLMAKTPTEEQERERGLTQMRAARTLAQMRWAGSTPEERSEFAAQVAAARTPEQMGAAKRSDKPRCPCGEMTLARAQARRHKCEAPKPAKPARRKK